MLSVRNQLIKQLLQNFSIGDDMVNTCFLKGNSNLNHRDSNNQLTGTSTDGYGYLLRPNESVYQLPAILTPTPV